jgi:hypothetical protein
MPSSSRARLVPEAQSAGLDTSRLGGLPRLAGPRSSVFWSTVAGNGLAERAFHALRLLEGSPLPLGARIQRQQTAFAVTIAAERCLVLQQHLSAEALAAITDPSSYAASQRYLLCWRPHGLVHNGAVA